MGQGGGAGAASRIRKAGGRLTRDRMGVTGLTVPQSRRALAGTSFSVNQDNLFITRRRRG